MGTACCLVTYQRVRKITLRESGALWESGDATLRACLREAAGTDRTAVTSPVPGYL